jgi:hypothetical protein
MHLKLEEKMAKLLVQLDPKLYQKHIKIEKGKHVMYVELKKPCTTLGRQVYCSGRSFQV